MAIITKTTQPGNNIISTLNGQIKIDEGLGKMIIYDPVTQEEVNVVDRTGYYLTDGTVSTRINPGSFVQYDGVTDRIFMGNEE